MTTWIDIISGVLNRLRDKQTSYVVSDAGEVFLEGKRIGTTSPEVRPFPGWRGNRFVTDSDRMDAFKYAWGDLLSGPLQASDAQIMHGLSATGRNPVTIHYTDFPGSAPGGPRGVLTYNPDLLPRLSEFDYAALEIRVANAFREMHDTMSLRSFADGTDLNVPVKPEITNSGGVWLNYGKARRWIGGDDPFDMLRTLGFQIELEHRRFYSVPGKADPVLMTAGEARYAVPFAGSLLYRDRTAPEGVRVESGEFSAMEPNGGTTTARVYHPAGFWAEGVARCRPDEWIKGEWHYGDLFNKEEGRRLAIKRACEGLYKAIPDA